jgi:hypothetical protein
MQKYSRQTPIRLKRHSDEQRVDHFLVSTRNASLFAKGQGRQHQDDNDPFKCT